jgi:DNA-binding NarL/FixJ family response regulator
MKILIADKQDITRAGLMYVIDSIPETAYSYIEDKTELMEALKEQEDVVVILDYTLFDINDAEELLILHERFPKTRWLLFSEDLSHDFVRLLIVSSNQFGVLMKESSLQEIREGIDFAIHSQRYICQRMTEMLLTPSVHEEEKVNLTKTEVEILKDIAVGMTTKEIAEKRFSSFHTVNTHRKNIFRKLGVNNVHEATKYALRAGLVDSAEYYI